MAGSDGVIKQIFVGVVTAVLITVILVKLGIKDSSSPYGKNEPTPQPTASMTPQALTDGKSTPQPSATSIPPQPSASVTSQPTPPESFTSASSLPVNNTCPFVQGGFWMQYSNIWYGPYGGGDAILLNPYGGFYVYNASMLNTYGTYGATLTYPDPYQQFQRNVWLPLFQSRFSICIDGSGYAYGIYQ